MAQQTFVISNFTQSSSFTVSYDTYGDIHVTTASTASVIKSFGTSALPDDATITSAYLYASGSASGTHTAYATTAFNGASIDSVSPTSDRGIQFTFKASNSVSYGTAAGTKTVTTTWSGVSLVVNYTIPITAPTVSNVLLNNSSATRYAVAGVGLTLSWTASNGQNNNISSYSIWYSDNGAGWVSLATGVGSASYTVYNHPTAGSNRKFLVQAIAPNGNSAQVQSPLVNAYSAVGVPVNVGITPASVFPDASVTLSWTASSSGVGTTVTGYQVLENGTAKTTVTGTSYTFSAPAAGSYTYKVLAVASVSGYNSGQSAGVALTVVPPASAFTLNKSTVEMDGAATIMATITPVNAAYNHDVTFALDTTRTSTANVPAGSTTRTFTIPLSWCVGVPNATSGQAACTVVTKNGTTVIGQTSTTFAVTVPAAVLPTVTLAIAAVGGFGSYYLKSRSSVTLMSTATGAQGSTIASQSLLGGGYSGSVSPFTTGVLNTVGTNAVSVTVTDSRSRQATSAPASITVTDYTAPVISAVTAFRSDASGAALEMGEYAAVKANLVVTALTGNTGTATVRTRISGGTWGAAVAIAHNTTVILSGILQANAYDVEITLTDTVGTVSTHTATIRKSMFMFDFRMDRAGIGNLAGATKTLEIPTDWTTNINADKLDGNHATAFAAASHNQDASTITTGTLAVERGGTGVTTAAAIGLLSYPIGAIYQSTVSTSPATLFGGTWAALGGRMLIGADGTYTAGSTGGAATHGHTVNNHAHTTAGVALSVAQLPAHSHVLTTVYNQNNGGTSYAGQAAAGSNGTLTTNNTGSGSAHAHGDTGGAAPGTNTPNHMPPYLSVYMWQRSA